MFTSLYSDIFNCNPKIMHYFNCSRLILSPVAGPKDWTVSMLTNAKMRVKVNKLIVGALTA